MLSALSVAELWRKEAARLAARSLLRASCRCRSTESRERSFTGCTLERGGFFGIGGGTFFSSCTDNGGFRLGPPGNGHPRGLATAAAVGAKAKAAVRGSADPPTGCKAGLHILYQCQDPAQLFPGSWDRSVGEQPFCSLTFPQLCFSELKSSHQ